jgi:hypothetical protein
MKINDLIFLHAGISGLPPESLQPLTGAVLKQHDLNNPASR